MQDVLVKKIAAFHRALDDDLSRIRPDCAGCGECCRFDRVDHIVYASRLERLYLLHVSPLPDPDPEADPETAALIAAGKRCPYQRGDVCLAREGRTLGCRLHFCRWPGGGEEEFSEKWHQRLKYLHDTLEQPWDYAPLLPLPLYKKRNFSR